MREKSYRDCLARHLSDLKFILENGDLDEKAAVLGPLAAYVDKIGRRIRKVAPKIPWQQMGRLFEKQSVNVIASSTETFEPFDLDLDKLRN